jgi:outer membrane protein TolC
MNLVRNTELPPGVRGPVVNSDFGDTVAMLIAIRGERYGYRELRDFADKIHDEMRTVRLVGKIATYGTQGEEIWITSSLERIAQYFPQLTNNSKYVALSDEQVVTVPAGSLGNLGGTSFPDRDMKIRQSDSTVFYSETTLAQPITQLFKIHEAHQIARADRGIAEAELTTSENETVYAVNQLYYTLLIAYKEKDAAEASLTAAEESMREREKDVKSGVSLDIALTAARASLLESKQALLAAENSISDVTAELSDVLGLPSDTLLEVSEQGLPEVTEPLNGEVHVNRPATGMANS